MAVGSIPNNNPVVPNYGTPGGVQSGGGATAVNGPRAAGETQGVRPPGGLSVSTAASEVSYSSPNLEGIDWDALSSDFQNVENLSLSITAIMVLLIDVMKEMRKGQREAWMDEAQNALQMGLNAADKMRESAAAKLAADVVTNAASIVTSAVSLASSAASMKATKLSNDAIDKRATDLYGPAKDVKAIQAGTESATTPPPSLKTPATDIRLETPSATAGSSVTTQSTTPALAADAAPEVAPQTAPTTPAQSGQTATAQPTAAKDAAPRTSRGSAEAAPEKDGASAAPKAEAASKEATSELKNQKARAQYVSQERSLAQAKFEQNANIAKSVTEIGASLAKMGASVGEYFAGMKQAESKEFEALGAYSSALMQAELEFANQMRDAIRSVLDTMKGAEQAKHQATQAIYNI